MDETMQLNMIFLLRLVLSVVLGGALGFERERKNKSAGLKTHILIAVAGCVLMWLSAHGFSEFKDHPNARFDPARLAAQVGGGIGGFLAAGIVLRSDKFALSGFSTAAMLLLAMIVGFTVGAGQYFVASATVAVVLACMFWVPLLQRSLKKPLRRRLQYVSKDRPSLLAEVATILGQMSINILDVSIEEDDDEDGQVSVTVEVNSSSTSVDWSLVEKRVGDVADVLSVKLD